MGYLDNSGLSKVFTKLKSLIDKKSDKGHTHNAVDIFGSVEIAHGGTGATTAKDALNNLGITWSTTAAPNTGTPNSIYIQIV